VLRDLVQRLKLKKPVEGVEPDIQDSKNDTTEENEWVQQLDVVLIDDQELAVFGEPSEIDAYLSGLSSSSGLASMDFQNIRGDVISGTANVLKAALEAGSVNGRWIKLTQESARQVKLNGLIPTKDPGVNFVVTGKPGHFGSILKAEKASLLKNPLVLANASAVVAQLAMSAELAAIKNMLKSIDAKIDDLKEQNRDEQLAKLDRVAFAIEDTKIRAKHMDGKINDLTWSQIQGENRVIDEAQAVALRRLDSLVEKCKGSGVKTLAKELGTIGQDAALWLTVLGRTFELREELAIIEVTRTHELPFEEAAQHRASVRSALDSRRQTIRAAVERFSLDLSEVAPIAIESAILHAVSSRKVVLGLNQALDVATKFETAFGKDEITSTIEPMHWIRAVRDPEQRKAALNQIMTPVIKTVQETTKETKKALKEIKNELRRPN
jgi:hypothetical protein